MMKYNRIILAVLASAAVFMPLMAAEKANAGDEVSRRRAFRQMLKSDRRKAIETGLRSRDEVIRSRAVLEVFRDKHQSSLPELMAAIPGAGYMVQSTIAGCLRALPDSPERRKAAAELRQNTGFNDINILAGAMANPFRFNRKKLRLSERNDWDHAISCISRIRLPEDDWRFAADPASDGHERDFYAGDFDDRAWKKIRSGHWETLGVPGYDGIGWYRIRFNAPEKPVSNAAELRFEGVDEEAWVWLNGVYIGQHTIGPSGWNKEFFLDVTGELRWGAENLLVVRVFDSKKGGGIWKPVHLHVLR